MLHDPACMERLLLDLSINVTSMFRDPTFFARVPREGRAAAAHVSVHPDLERGLLDRRGDLLARDPAEGGGALRPHRASTRPTSTTPCSSARARAASRSSRCATTPRTTCGPAAPDEFSRYYTVEGDEARFTPELRSRWCSPSTTWSRTRPSTSSTSSCAATS